MLCFVVLAENRPILVVLGQEQQYGKKAESSTLYF